MAQTARSSGDLIMVSGPVDPPLDELIDELARRYPRFRRVTIARLVRRVVDACAVERPETGLQALLPMVRQEADEQLQYLDADL